MVPDSVVTNTLAVPAAPAGVVAVIDVELTTVMPIDATPPMVTAVATVSFVPMMVTLVPPRVVPVAGAILVTVGAGGGGVTNV